MEATERTSYGESLAYLTLGIADICESLKKHLMDHGYDPRQQFRITRNEANRILVQAIPIDLGVKSPDIYPITELLIDAAPHYFPNHKAIEWIVTERLNR